MMKKYTHIFFDLDNTLWDFETNSRFAMRATFEYFNLNVLNIEFNDFFKVYSKHNHVLWAKYRKKELGKKELTRRRFNDTFEELNIEEVDPDIMNAFYLKEMPKQKILKNGVIETLRYLKAKQYKLYIITNGFRDVQHKKLERSELKPFFRKVFTSEEIKTPKPGREIFEYAIKSANAKKANSLMVGDDWDADVMGASNYGLDAVFISIVERFTIIDPQTYALNGNVIYRFDSIEKIRTVL